MLVQGAGGNVSWKKGDELWVKASGTWLADANKKDIFVPIDLKHLKAAIENNDFYVTPKLLNNSALRPSIETLLHALMPQRVILHVHAIEPLAYLVRSHPEYEISQKLKGAVSWKMVPYQKPGEKLARAVARVCQDSPGIKVLLLQSHGLVIGGNDIAEVDHELRQIISLLSAPEIDVVTNAVLPDPIFIDVDLIYNPVNNSEIQRLAQDTYLFDRIKTDWALYPDHVVFLGHCPTCYDSIQMFEKDIEVGVRPELFFLKDRGVFVNNEFNLAKYAQLKCFYDVIVRQPRNASLNTLSHQQISDLLNWDAEQYRQKMAK